jgi:predicted adenylyl cyclase CyaB
MARNVEIKARIHDVDEVRARAAALSDAPSVMLEQEDTFFRVPEGRLKLRVFPSGKGELIAYFRPDTSGPKTSEYFLYRTADPESLKGLLVTALGVRGVVRKRRMLYLVGRTRIHLDEVEGLGAFLELEVVLEDGQPEAEGEAIARHLLGELGVRDEDRVAKAYIDLLEEESER